MLYGRLVNRENFPSLIIDLQHLIPISHQQLGTNNFQETSSKKVQVELYLQNADGCDTQISAETWDTWFKRWLEILQPDIPTAPSYELGLRLTDDDEIQSLNAQYRHQNQPTDVLAFAALEVDYPQPIEMLTCESLYLGDIVISIDRAKHQAQQQEHSLLTELAWLACHGLLHLLGWDHPDEESLSRMLKQQVILLKTIGVAIDLE